MNLTVYNADGKQVGEYEIDPSELSPKINKQLLHDAVVMYQANLRQGTFRTKSRGEVSGTTKKMYRQKGTGNARAGSKRSGVRRGGGHIFAKRPRDFSWRMPRKALQSATRMALAARLADEEGISFHRARGSLAWLSHRLLTNWLDPGGTIENSPVSFIPNNNLLPRGSLTPSLYPA